MGDVPYPVRSAGRPDLIGVRVFSLAIIATAPHSIPVSKLRRPFLSDRYFFVAVRLLRGRKKFTEPDFALLARAFNRARALHPFHLTAWVFSPIRRLTNTSVLPAIRPGLNSSGTLRT